MQYVRLRLCVDRQSYKLLNLLAGAVASSLNVINVDAVLWT